MCKRERERARGRESKGERERARARATWLSTSEEQLTIDLYDVRAVGRKNLASTHASMHVVHLAFTL